MITSRWQGYELSRMMLGTVQLGLPYGIANRTGQPSYGDVLAIGNVRLPVPQDDHGALAPLTTFGGSSTIDGLPFTIFACSLMICTVAMPATAVVPSARLCATASGQTARRRSPSCRQKMNSLQSEWSSARDGRVRAA